MSETVLRTLIDKYGKLVEDRLRKYLTLDVAEEFREPVLYQIATGGKRVRPLLTLAFAEACGGNPEDALPEACIVELIHEYSLIFDDIIDHSVVRRGKPTVWKRYGTSTAMLIGLWYREAIEEAVLDSHNPQLVGKIVSKTIKEIIEGERLDILLEAAGRDDPYIAEHRIINRLNIDKLEELYFNMIRKKTAALIRTACMLGALTVRRNIEDELVKAAAAYGEYVGIAFQLIDDLLDIYGKFEKFGKEIGKDLKEHKLGNAVVMYFIKLASENDRNAILSILRKDTITQEDIEKSIELFNKYNIREMVLSKARDYITKAIDALRPFPNESTRKILEEFAKFIVEREY